MACSHLAAAGASSPATAAVRAPAHSPATAAAAFARLRSTPRTNRSYPVPPPPPPSYPDSGRIVDGPPACICFSPPAGFATAGLSVKGNRAAFPVVAAAGPAAAAPVADLEGRPATEKQPIIVIDNYDSFTYNLCQYMGELGLNFEVYRNDELTIEDVKRKNPRGILISPGPGEPQDSGISLQAVLELGPTIPIFGVCMGLQCIGEAFGGKIIRAPSGVMHGKSSPVYYDEELGKALFNGLPNPFTAARYHSLVIEEETFPHDALEATAWTEDGLIMAARHKKYKHIQGVQFHPESIITPEGKKIILNFVRFIEELEKQRS